MRHSSKVRKMRTRNVFSGMRGRMSNPAWASVIIGGLSLVFLLMSGILGLLWRAAKNAGSMGMEIRSLVESTKNIAEQLDKHIDWHLGRARRP